MADKAGLSSTGLFPTPPVPEGIPPIELSNNSREVLARRYLRHGKDGAPVETIDEMFWRVAYHVAAVESEWNGDIDARAREFYTMLTEKRFFPNSPTFTGAGTPLGQLAACFVLPISDDMGRRGDGIFTTLRNAALIQQTGGGNGFSFAPIAPLRRTGQVFRRPGHRGRSAFYESMMKPLARLPRAVPGAAQTWVCCESITRISKSSSPARPMKTRSPISIYP